MANETKGKEAGTVQESPQGQQQIQGSRSGRQEKGAQLQGRTGADMGERREGNLALLSRDPFAVAQQLSQEMDRLFESFFYGLPHHARGESGLMRSVWAPELEICEEGNHIVVRADLPGLAKDDVKVDIKEGMLTIQGERREKREEGGEQQGYRRSERRYGSFYRTIALPDYVDLEHAEAKMKDGVLEIRLPVSEQREARRIEIQGG
ncbi:MAG TPA: Hsp20/alpha crystallin family protein [Burkholderiales bacterium]|nr:Hsp20/alpha crystallin family protein [Burkholderiales bacterium]